MSEEIYKINKNIDRPLVFKGLKDQYIYYYLAVVIISFILFGVLNSMGVGTLYTLLITGVVAFAGIKGITIISDRFGKNGLKKYMARRKVPESVQIESRAYFLNLNRDNDEDRKIR